MSGTVVVLVSLFGLTLGAELPGRIIGGEPTTIEEHPYQLSLRQNTHHMCGASIIAPRFALTAAHCVAKASVFRLTLHAGTSYVSQFGSTHQIAAIHVHPEFTGLDYDYAVLQVVEPFPIGAPGVDSISLCSIEPSYDQVAIVSGWGKIDNNGTSPEQLQAVRIPIIARKNCQSKWAAFTYTQRMICAGPEDSIMDACVGDSGGPLVVNGKQCGIVSWGLECGDPNHPGVYSNVADQFKWIKEIAGL